MSVSLQKGGNVSLSKEAPGLTKALIGLGWDPRVSDGVDFDLDASVFILGEDDMVRNPKDFIFYNNKTSPCGSVAHLGDNLTGEGEGDDEQITIDLSKVPDDVKKLRVVVSIHEAESRDQNFGQVSNAFIRIASETDGQEIARYDLSEDASVATAMVFGEVYRHNDEWKFRAVGQGYQAGLGAIAQNCGVSLG